MLKECFEFAAGYMDIDKLGMWGRLRESAAKAHAV
jgi:hypothetical protein